MKLFISVLIGGLTLTGSSASGKINIKNADFEKATSSNRALHCRSYKIVSLTRELINFHRNRQVLVRTA